MKGEIGRKEDETKTKIISSNFQQNRHVSLYGIYTNLPEA